jgi:hypothetical protein
MSFAYHRAIAPMMWAIFALSVAEVAVVHLMLGFWYPRLALILTIISLAFVVWLGWAIASFKAMPVELGTETLLMPIGLITSIAVPIDTIADVVGEPSRDQINARGTADLAIIAHPNILVLLKTPLERGGWRKRRPVVAIAHRLDDPAAFITALRTKIV